MDHTLPWLLAGDYNLDLFVLSTSMTIGATCSDPYLCQNEECLFIEMTLFSPCGCIFMCT